MADEDNDEMDVEATPVPTPAPTSQPGTSGMADLREPPEPLNRSVEYSNGAGFGHSLAGQSNASAGPQPQPNTEGQTPIAPATKSPFALVQEGAGSEVLGVDDEGNTTHEIFMVGNNDQTLIALDGQTVRVLDSAKLDAPVGTFGEPAMKVKAAIALGSGTTVVVRYVDAKTNKPTNYLECWNYKTQQSMWEIRVDGDVTHMTAVFDSNKNRGRFADAIVVASKIGMTRAGISVIAADGKFRNNPVSLEGRIIKLVSDVDAGGNAALAITDEGTVAWVGSDGQIQGEPVSIEGLISTLCMNQDGSEAVAGTVDGQVWWIDSAYGERPDQKPIQMKGGISHLKITPDGSQCLAGTMHGVVAWLTPDGIRGESELQGMSTYVTALQMSLDGMNAVVGSNVGSLEWIGYDGIVAGEVAQLGSEITHLKINTEGTLALVGTKEGGVAWVGFDGQVKGKLSMLGGAITTMKISWAGNTGVAGLDTGEVVWFGEDGEPTADRANLFGKITQITLKANGTGALAVTDEGTAAWVSTVGVVEGATAETDELMTALIMNPAADTVLAAATKYDDDGYRSTIMWLAQNHGLFAAAAELRGESCRMRGDYTRVPGQVTLLAISDDGNAGVAGTQEGDVTWINQDGGEMGATVKLEGSIVAMAMNQAGDKVLVGTSSGVVAWVSQEGDIVSNLTVNGEVTVLATHKGGKGKGVIGTRERTGNGLCYRVDKECNQVGEPTELSGAITTLVAHPDGKTLVGTGKGVIAWLDTKEGKAMRQTTVPVRPGEGGICQVELTSDGMEAIVATNGGIVARIPYEMSKDMELLSGFTKTPVKLLPYGEKDEFIAFDLGAQTVTFLGRPVEVGFAQEMAAKAADAAASGAGAVGGAVGGEGGEGGAKAAAVIGGIGGMGADAIGQIGINLSNVPTGAMYKFNSQDLMMGQWTEDHPLALIGDQLIFGRSLRHIWGVDVSIMMVHGIEVTNSIGPTRDEMSPIEQYVEFFSSRFNYAQASALLFITQWQFISMAFHPSIGWLLPKRAMFWIRFPATFGLDSEWVPAPPDGKADDDGESGSVALTDDEQHAILLAADDTNWWLAIGGFILTASFVAILHLQEKVENMVFLGTPGPWLQVWHGLQGFCAALAGPLFMPVVGVLLDPLSNTDGSVLNQFKLYPVQAFMCLACSFVFIMLSLRMVRVDNALSAIEFVWYRPHQMKKDIGTKQVSDHPLSELEELWLPSFKRSLANRNTNLKLFNIAVPSVYPHNPKTISITIMLTGLWLSVDSFLAVDRSSGLRFSGPYPDAKTNKGLFMLKLLTFLTGFWATCIATMNLDGDTSDTMGFQVVFGVIAVGMLVIPAIFLTPLMTIFLRRTQPPKPTAADIMRDLYISKNAETINPSFEVEGVSPTVDQSGHVDAEENGGVEWKDDY